MKMKATKDNGFLKVAQQAHLKSELHIVKPSILWDVNVVFTFCHTEKSRRPSGSTFPDNLLVTRCNLLWCTFGCSLLLSQDNVQLPLHWKSEFCRLVVILSRVTFRYQRFSCLTSFEIITPDQSCHLEPDAAWFSDTKSVWAFQA